MEGTNEERLTNEINTYLLRAIRVTQAFIPYFRKHKKALFIATASIGGLVTFSFNSIYHATKWVLEGWSESLSFELGQFGIGVKTVSPVGISTDFASRKLVMTNHAAYSDRMEKVLQVFKDPGRVLSHSTAEDIAAEEYEAATDGKKQLRYVARNDAKAIYAQRLQVGDETFRNGVMKLFFVD